MGGVWTLRPKGFLSHPLGLEGPGMSSKQALQIAGTAFGFVPFWVPKGLSSMTMWVLRSGFVQSKHFKTCVVNKCCQTLLNILKRQSGKYVHIWSYIHTTNAISCISCHQLSKQPSPFQNGAPDLPSPWQPSQLYSYSTIPSPLPPANRRRYAYATATFVPRFYKHRYIEQVMCHFMCHFMYYVLF